jgi:iron(III) transport system ATP-binding protein
MLVIKQLALAYDKQPVLSDLSLSLMHGEIGCLLGPSGSGKSSLLRAIAGFESIQAGEIEVEAVCLSKAQYQVPPEQRQIGMVFQDYALFPHLTVAENIAFGLAGKPYAAQQARVSELLQLIGLAELAQRYPHQLSGGQQQRVALARALAPKPRLLLLDEPFSGLDAFLREQLAADVQRVLQSEKITALFVTHDQQEAFALADRIGVIFAGQLQQWAEPLTLYHQPATAEVAAFIGSGHWLNASVDATGQLECALGRQQVQAEPGRYRLLVRPEDVRHDDQSSLQARVLKRTFCGSYLTYLLELADGQQLSCQLDSHHLHQCGEWIGLTPSLRHWVIFPKQDRSDE